MALTADRARSVCGVETEPNSGVWLQQSFTWICPTEEPEVFTSDQLLPDGRAKIRAE